MINQNLRKKLIEIAKKRGYVYYSDLAAQLGYPYDTIDERNAFHHELGEISRYEHYHGRPLLSVLVVRSEPDSRYGHRMCGQGFFDLAKNELGFNFTDQKDFFLKEMNKVHNYWSNKSKKVK